MQDALQDFLQAHGIKDYDALTAQERQTYFELLAIQESSKITLEDLSRAIKAMRQSIEQALATEKLDKFQDLFYKARLKNMLVFEAFFDRPEKAREMLNHYKKRSG